jgi:putative membrane protein
MFIDYLTLMLANMAAALFLLSLYFVFFFEKDPKKAVPGFLITGGIALVTGLAMSLTWPLPGSYNIAFGEPTVLLGALFFMAGLAINFGWELLTVGIFAFGAGAVAIFLGIRILDLRMTTEPEAASIGYILTGLAALLALPAIALPRMKWIRWVAAIVALVAAGIWVFVAFSSYWVHLKNFGTWTPDAMFRIPPPPAPAAQ